MARPEAKLAKALICAGWTEVRRTKHVIWRCGCGGHEQVVVASSVGRGRGMANIVAFLASEARFGDCAIDKRRVLG